MIYTLNEGDDVNGYKVGYLIKKGTYNDTYRVEKSGKPYFMKFYDVSAVPDALKERGTVDEILACREIKHKNVISYVDDGVYSPDGNQYQYLITDFFVGILLSEKIRLSKKIQVDEAKNIFGGILSGLSYLHSLGYCHNDITPANILLETSPDGTVTPKIIDLGHIYKGFVGGAPKFPVIDLELEYCASEALMGIFNPKTDAFSAMAVLYTMLTGCAPWKADYAGATNYQERKRAVKKSRQEELSLESISDELKELVANGLEKSPDERADVDRIIQALSLSDELNTNGSSTGKIDEKEGEREFVVKEKKEVKQVKQGGGFKEVAGMDDLKAALQDRVIWVLNDKERALRYRLTPPNGMLLYGPPGCGKTFFAQKFAEESKYNFFMVNGSDLGSIYVHGTQGKIAELFKKARKQAPCIICFDEFDAFVPSRSTPSAEHKADEVNEFLSQLNNCSKDGIFVIGTTNRIDMIDPAVLRKGRMDLQFEVPAPDKETRATMFHLYLKDRPLADDINCEELSDLTDNYASADIAFIVNEAAMMAALANEDISHQHLLNAIKCNPSSLRHIKKPPHVGFKK